MQTKYGKTYLYFNRLYLDYGDVIYDQTCKFFFYKKFESR